MSRIEIYRTEDGEYRGRLFDEEGKVVRFRPGSSALKRTARQREEDRAAVQSMLKSMYDEQQAAGSAS